MYKREFLCNPKHLALMTRSVRRIEERIFDEFDIRTLLLGIRAFADEVANETKSSINAPSHCKNGFRYLSDIGHSIAHPEHKTKGPLRDFVKKTDSEMKRSTKKMARRKVLKVDETDKIIHLAMPPHQKPISSCDILTALYSALKFVTKIELNYEKILPQSDDILLCIFSILHFTQIPLYDEENEGISILKKKGGYLGLHSWNGFYHLYCGVLNSEFETIFGTKRNEKPFISTFPVMHSNKAVGDGIRMDIANPNFVVAIRDSSGVLGLRNISQY